MLKTRNIFRSRQQHCISGLLMIEENCFENFCYESVKRQMQFIFMFILFFWASALSFVVPLFSCVSKLMISFLVSGTMVASAVLGAAAGTGMALFVAMTIVVYRYYTYKRKAKEWGSLDRMAFPDTRQPYKRTAKPHYSVTQKV